MTANDSFSSVNGPTDSDSLNLLATGRFPPLAEAFLLGRSRELLAPVRFLAPGEHPTATDSPVNVDRRALSRALAEANDRHGHPRARQLADDLADPSTCVVITGQQPGLFGGPMYTLSKAVAAELWAARLREMGQPAVALFWVATEDHDFRETSRATFLTAGGARTFDLGDDRQPLVPVGRRVLGPEVSRILAELRQAIPGERFGDWLAELEDWYAPDARFGDAFAKLMVRVLGPRCPLLVDAMLPELKRAQRPWMRQIVEERIELATAFESRDHEIIAKGYPLQVRPQQGASPLFLEHEGQRRRIEWRGTAEFRLRGEESFKGSVEDLLGIIDADPGRVSPGVRARSAIQDAVFGTYLQVLGPGEMSYLPQAAPLFDLLGVTAPRVTLRPQILVLDERQRTRSVESGIGIPQLLDPAFDLDRWLAPPEDMGFLEVAEEELEALLGALQGPSLSLDGNLERPLKKTADQMWRALKAYRSKVTAAASRQDATQRARLEALRESCLPFGRLQERVVVSVQFPARYGDDLVEAIFEQMNLDPTKLSIVTP